MEEIVVLSRKVEYEIVGECWEVTSHRPSNRGYPMIKVKGWGWCIHRALYMERILGVKDLSSDIHILHSCDNRKCINPKHLRAGTHTENMQDKTKRNRNNSPKGVKHNKAKFTEQQIRDIRRLGESNLDTQAEIAKTYNTTRRHIQKILYKEVWKHI